MSGLLLFGKELVKISSSCRGNTTYVNAENCKECSHQHLHMNQICSHTIWTGTSRLGVLDQESLSPGNNVTISSSSSKFWGRSKMSCLTLVRCCHSYLTLWSTVLRSTVSGFLKSKLMGQTAKRRIPIYPK